MATLLNEGLIDGETLIQRIDKLPVKKDIRERLIKWVEITADEIG